MILDLSECPNCGAPLDGKPRLRCPYCGGRLWDPEKKRQEICKNLKVDKITTFIPQERAEETLVELMISEDDQWSEVPKEVFDNLVIKSKKVYIPLWIFSGNFEAHWQCINEITDSSESLVIQRVPMQGVAQDSFIAVASASGRGEISIIDDFFDSDFKNYSLSMIENDADVKPISIERNEAWKKACKKLEYKAERAVEGQVPNYYRDLSFSVKYSYNKYISILCACWELTFEYDGNIYTSIRSKIYNSIKFPIKKKEKRINKQDCSSNSNKTIKNDSSEKAKVTPRINLTFFGWGCFILFCIGCIVALWAFIENSIMIAITSSIYAILSALFGISMNFKQQTEDELIKGIDEKQKELNSNNNSIRRLLLAPTDKNDAKKHELNERISYILNTRYFSNPQKESFKKKIENRLDRELEKEKRELEKEKNDMYLKNLEIQNRKQKIEQTGKELKKELDGLINSYHKKLSADKRFRFIYGLILVFGMLITVSFIVNNIIVQENNQRAEAERIDNEWNEVFNLVSNGYISPSVIFNKKASEFGHLKSGITDYLLQKGYVKQESDELLSGPEYCLQYNGNDLVKIEVFDNRVSFEFANENDAQRYWEKFKSEIESMGFVYIKKTGNHSISSREDVYIRVGKILKKQKSQVLDSGREKRARIDCVSPLVTTSFSCCSYDRIKEIQSFEVSDYERYPIDMNDQQTIWDLYVCEGWILN